jgi:hypothetical protein
VNPEPPAAAVADRPRPLARRLERPLAGVIAAAAWVGLAVQYAVALAAAEVKHRGWPGTTVRYLGYFTILSNLVIAAGLTSKLLAPRSAAGRFFARPSVATATALYIAVVALVYHGVLARLWHPTGWQKLADLLLHGVVPAAYLLHWALVLPRARLPWRAPLAWLLFPAAYFLYTLLKGPWVGYPYPFMDAGALGYGVVLLNGLYLLLVFLVLGLALVAIGRWLARRG